MSAEPKPRIHARVCGAREFFPWFCKWFAVTVSELAIAGANPAKAAALKRVAAILNIRCARRIPVQVDESGPSFADNACAKALAASRAAPRALALASDGGLEIPALGARWNPLRTARFNAAADPRRKSEALIELAKDLREDERAARWAEALAIALGGRTLACWTERGPRCVIANAVPSAVGHFWVDGLLERCESDPGHWELLARRFAEFCRA